MDNNDGKNLYDEMLEIFKNKGYNVDEFVETLEVDNLEKKLDEALNEYKNKINRMLEIATEKLPKKRKKITNPVDETTPITENKNQ